MYQAQIGRDAANGELTSGDWQAAFDIESLSDRASLQFPFDSQSAALVPDGIKVDGQAGVFHWDEKQHSLAIELGASGRRHVEVLLRPQRRRGGFEFAIPAAATAQLDLTKSTAAALEVETAIGAAKAAAEFLGPATKIIVRPLELASAAGSAKAPVFDVDELYWMHVRPGSVTIDGRYRIKVREGQVQQLQLLADSRLLPLGASSGGTIKTRRVSDKWNAIADHVAGASHRRRYDRRLFPGGGGPRYRRSSTAAIASRWRGRRAALVGGDLGSGAGDERNARIHHAIAGALAIRRIVGLRRDQASVGAGPQRRSAEISLTTRLRETKFAARCRLALDVGEESTDVRFAANVTAQGGSAFAYRLTIPAALEIEDVSVDDSTGRRPAHWARTSDKLLTILLAAPASGEIRLLARGRMPRSGESKFSLPEIHVQGSDTEKLRAIITRTSDMLVTVSDPGGLKALPAGEIGAALAEAQHDGLIEPVRAGEEQLVAILDGPQESQPAVLRVEPNRARVRTVQATSINRGAEAWQAAVDLSLQIDDGVLDVLRFELPPQWTGPFKITPAMPFAVNELPGLNQRQLVVFPETPLSGATHLHIAGPLTVAGGERPAAPDVYLAARRDWIVFSCCRGELKISSCRGIPAA